MDEASAGIILALATENTELRQQLAQAQDLLVETAVDAGELHGRIEALQADLDAMRAERDAWMAEARGRRGTALRTA
jgi:peptidoglycan hydrolase CwlO-like protein